MLFRYTGDPRFATRDPQAGNQETMLFRGYKFRLEQVTDIPESDTETVVKLQANSHFQEIRVEIHPVFPVEAVAEVLPAAQPERARPVSRKKRSRKPAGKPKNIPHIEPEERITQHVEDAGTAYPENA